jgi:SAM-dependent methyltransferase
VPLVPLFALTLFFSATLLFLVQPMVGKLVLPYLGGTPAVWNTCMVFFQALLLAGYAYAHALSRRFRPRTQFALHAAVSLLALVPLLLVRFNVGALANGWLPPPREANPIPWLLLVLLVTAGPAFFVASASAPLLQRWFAGTSHPSARDPYFLYAASNLGSLLALLSYPTLVEPHLGLLRQADFWCVGYVGLVLLALLCGAAAVRSAPAAAPEAGDTSGPAPTWWRRCRWVALAFVPSSLLLGVTTHLTTDLAAVPLLWVLPLTVYLLSFVLAFSPLGGWFRGASVLLLPFAVAALALEDDLVQWLDWNVFQQILLHLLALLVASVACHGELARTRPPARYLTGFYLLLSLGGVLGGVFNTLVAPLALDRLAEYPLVIALALLLVPRLGPETGRCGWRWVEAGFAAGLVLVGLLAGLFFWARAYLTPKDVYSLARHLPDAARPAADFLARRLDNDDSLAHRERNFFGTFIVRNYYRHYVLMEHGTTTHGAQDREQPGEPLTYFHRSGAVGQLFESAEAKSAGRPLRVAVLGVGTVTLAAYLKPDWRLTLYEIDPAVVRVARNRKYFTYLSDAEERGARVEVVLGDGRLQIRDAPDASYDLLFMDAFTSDAVPVHLLTREAIQIYLRKLAPGGMIVVNVANRYLVLNAVLGNLADDLGLEGRVQEGDVDWAQMKFSSTWVVLARSAEDFGDLLGKCDGGHAWEPLERDERVGVWTDDYSNLLRVLRWRQ